MPVKNPQETEEKSKPSQAEGERDQPGDEENKNRKETDFPEPAKPSQAEGERKPYT
jgi:hypothetical protein